jgi:hypothetical protein
MPELFVEQASGQLAERGWALSAGASLDGVLTARSVSR